MALPRVAAIHEMPFLGYRFPFLAFAQLSIIRSTECRRDENARAITGFAPSLHLRSWRQPGGRRRSKVFVTDSRFVDLNPGTQGL